MTLDARLALVSLALVPACYAPHDAASTNDDASGGGSSSGSTGISTTPTTTAPGTEDSSSSTQGDASSSSSADVESSSSGPTGPICGNGEIEDGEVCDDGENDGSYDGCNPGCTELGPHCGDGVTNGKEPCDDGDPENGNGCNVDCIISGTVLWTVNSSEGYEFTNASSWDRRVAVDAAGDAYIVGDVSDDGNQAATLVRKYSADGDEVWAYVYDPAYGATPGGVAVGGAGEVVFTVNHYPGPEGEVRRLTAVGGLAWSQIITNPGMGVARGLAVDLDESLVIGGSQDQTDPTYEGLLVRLDEDSGELWRENNSDVPDPWEDVAIDDSGDIFACGGGTVRRHTSNGTTVWTMDWGSGACRGIAPTDDGGAIAIGSANDDGRIVRVDANGDVLWTEFFDGASADDELVDGAFDGTHVAVVGYTYEGTDRSILVAKYSLSGDLEWTRTATGGANENSGDGVAVDADGYIFASGFINSASGAHLWLSKMTP